MSEQRGRPIKSGLDDSAYIAEVVDGLVSQGEARRITPPSELLILPGAKRIAEVFGVSRSTLTYFGSKHLEKNGRFPKYTSAPEALIADAIESEPLPEYGGRLLFISRGTSVEHPRSVVDPLLESTQVIQPSNPEILRRQLEATRAAIDLALAELPNNS